MINANVKERVENDHESNHCKTFMCTLSNQWEKLIENQPTLTIAGRRRHLSVLLWSTAICVSVFFSYQLVNMQSYVTTINKITGAAIRLPDVIVCPMNDEQQRYNVWYNQTIVKQLSISREQLDQIAEFDANGKENNSIPKNLQHLASKLNVSSVSAILLSVWCGSCYDTDVRHRRGRFGGMGCLYDLDCRNGTNVWLWSNLCILFDNRRLFSTKHMYIYFSEFIEKDIGTSSVRAWVGNLQTDHVDNLNDPTKVFSQGLYYKTVPYHIIYSQKGKEVVCQKELEKDAQFMDCKPGSVVHSNFWTYDIKMEPYRHPHIKIRHQVEGGTHYEINEKSHRSNIQITGEIGGVIGVISGLSFFSIFSSVIDACKKKKVIQLVLKVITWIVLLISFAFLQYSDFANFLNNIYFNTTDIGVAKFGDGISGSGIPLPSVKICWYSSIYNFVNISMLIDYNISAGLLRYLKAAACYSGFGDIVEEGMPILNVKGVSVNVPFEEAMQIVAFSLLRLPDFVFPSTLLNDMDEEYDQLLKKLKLEKMPNVTGYDVYRKFLADPCEIIEKCTVDDILIHDCCKIVDYVLDARFLKYCLWLPNNNDQWQQKIFGPSGGLKIFIKPHYLMEIDKYKNMIYVGSTLSKYFNGSYVAEKEIKDNRRILFVVDVAQHHFGYHNFHDIEHKDFLAGSISHLQITSKLTELLAEKRESQSHCASRPECFIYKREIDVWRQLHIKKICGCYICHGVGTIKAYSHPCCDAKKALRCLTRKEAYEQHVFCDTAYTTKINKITLVWNESKMLEYKPNLFLSGWCNALEWFYNKLSPSFGEIQIEDNLADCRLPCSQRAYSVENIVHGKSNDKAAKHVHTLNIYFVSDVYEIIKEIDGLHVMSIIGITFGAAGIVFGTSVISLGKTCWLFAIRVVLCLSRSAGSDNANNIKQKIKSKWKKINGKIMLNDKGKFVMLILLTANILCSAVGVWLLFLEYDRNPTSIEYQLRQSIIFPSIAICEPKMGRCSPQNLGNDLQNSNCSAFGNKLACFNLFAIKIQTEKHNCLLTASTAYNDSVEIDKSGDIFKMQLKLQHTIRNSIWIGDPVNSRISPSFEVTPEKSILIQFKPFEKKLSSNCVAVNSVTCPICDAQCHSRAKVCCSQAAVLIPSILSTPLSKASCQQTLFITTSTASNVNMEGVAEIIVSMQNRQVQVFTEQRRLSFFDHFVLYSGMIFTFIGLNYLGTVHFLVTLLCKMNTHDDL